MTPFKNNHQFRGFLQRRGPVQPVQPMRSMSNDRPSEGPRVLQPQPVKQPAGPMVQPPAQPQADQPQVNQPRMDGPRPGVPYQQEAMKAGPLVQPPQIPSKVAGQIKDVQSEFDQARASLEAKPEVSALVALSKQAATMDPNSPQAADLRSKLEQAKGMLSQSPEYQRVLAAAQTLQQRAADEAAFQNGYATSANPWEAHLPQDPVVPKMSAPGPTWQASRQLAIDNAEAADAKTYADTFTGDNANSFLSLPEWAQRKYASLAPPGYTVPQGASQIDDMKAEMATLVKADPRWSYLRDKIAAAEAAQRA